MVYYFKVYTIQLRNSNMLSSLGLDSGFGLKNICVSFQCMLSYSARILSHLIRSGSFFFGPLYRGDIFFDHLLWSIFQLSLHMLHITNHAGPSVLVAIHVLHSRHFLSGIWLLLMMQSLSSVVLSLIYFAVVSPDSQYWMCLDR